MAGKHAAPKAKPSPYAIASGAVAYSLAVTFAKHVPVDVIAAAPAAIAVGVAAIERGIAEIDPKAAPAVDATIDRLAAQAEGAAQDLARITSAGVSDAAHVVSVVAPSPAPAVAPEAPVAPSVVPVAQAPATAPLDVVKPVV